MKVNKAEAVALMLAVGFQNAETWDNEKLIAKLTQLPERLTLDAVPDKFHKLYNAVKATPLEVPLEIVDDGAAKPAKAGKQAKAAKPAKEDKQAKAKTAKDAKAAKSKEKAEIKAAKKAKAKEERPRDEYGSALDTVRAKVNATFSKDWKTDEQTAKEAGVTVRQARMRLRRATKAGILIKERIIRYRLATEQDKKDAVKASAKK